MKSHEAWGVLRVLWASEKRTILTTLSILIVVLVLVYGLYAYREHQVRKLLVEADSEQLINDSAAEERVVSIARRFECVACDTCKNKPWRRVIVGQAKLPGIIYGERFLHMAMILPWSGTLRAFSVG
ncbi:hypothetical protein D4R75_01500 [bacterium]|nr:MAG: hypothetical protein D4R75_01500 [bacterium]